MNIDWNSKRLSAEVAAAQPYRGRGGVLLDVQLSNGRISLKASRDEIFRLTGVNDLRDLAGKRFVIDVKPFPIMPPNADWASLTDCASGRWFEVTPPDGNAMTVACCTTPRDLALLDSAE